MAMTEDEESSVWGAINDLLAEVDDLKKVIRRQNKKIKNLVSGVESARYAATQNSVLLSEIIGENKFLLDADDAGYGWLWEMNETSSDVDGEPDFFWSDGLFKYEEIRDKLNGIKKIDSRLLDNAAVFLNGGLDTNGH